MRQRLIALAILLFMIGLPVFWYWFFFVKNISGIEIFVGSGVTADVKLSGSFSYGWLPLADRALRFEQKCENSCIFSPIPPADYTVEISAENFAKITENFSLKNGEKLVKKFSLTPTTTFSPIELPTPLSLDEKKLRSDDIRAALWNDFSLIDRDIQGNLWVWKYENSLSKIGIFRDNRFISVAEFPYFFTDTKLDFYNNSLILSTNSSLVLMNITGQNIFENSFADVVSSAFFSDEMWHIRTADHTLFYKNSWQENPRFSHFIDLDYWRAGFIASGDEKRISLGNYSREEGSVLVLLNRQNGDVFEIARNLDISRFFVFDGKLIFENSWKFYSINLPK